MNLTLGGRGGGGGGGGREENWIMEGGGIVGFEVYPSHSQHLPSPAS